MPWRVFPWDAAAKPGEPFSSSYVYPNQGSGRFDLRDVPVLYLAETAVRGEDRARETESMRVVFQCNRQV